MAVSSQPLTTNQIGTSPFFQRLRRRLRTVGSVPSEHSNQNKAWRILHLLSLHTRSNYETCQRIRTREFHTLEV